MEYYNSKIQLHIDVIRDVFTEINENKKMLVFGLGYDSKMWYEGNKKNTFFIEDNDKYIELNKNDIPSNNIVKYDYKINCSRSFELTDNEIKDFVIPEKIANEAPFDIIIIDAPVGCNLNNPGRLIPCYWSTVLSKHGTVIYIDDANRPLEKFCIQKFFFNFPKKEFNERLGCIKVYI